MMTDIIINSDTYTPYYIEIDKLSLSLLCIICHHPFVDPVSLRAKNRNQNCNHTYCSECINKWFTTQSGLNNSLPNQSEINPYNCPTCRRAVSSRLHKADHPTCSILDSLAVKCVNYLNGCNWIGERSQWQDHCFRFCIFRHINCIHNDFGCTWRDTHDRLEEHLNNTCNYNNISGVLKKIANIDDSVKSQGDYQRIIAKRLERLTDESENILKQIERLGIPHTEYSTYRTQLKDVISSIVNLILSLSESDEDEI